MESNIVRLPLESDGKQKDIFSATVDQYKYIAHELKAIILTQRQICDLELILNGGFAPLTNFLNKVDYESVLAHSRLQNGSLWPIPIMLDVDEAFLADLQPGDEVALRDTEGLLLAIMLVQEWWEADKNKEANAVFGTHDQHHPGVNYLFNHTKKFYISGKLLEISLPCHYDFNHLRFTPTKLREVFLQKGWQKVVAFQTRNPMHKAHQELTLRAAQQTDAALLLHPVVGLTKPGDIEYYTRIRCYEHILKTYPKNSIFLSLLPLAMRMAGPKEALWHALIRKNYGCTHFIVGRDHAGPGKNKDGQDYYSPYAAQEFTLSYQSELGIQILPFQEMVYSHKQKKYFAINEFPADEKPANISGTELRERLFTNQDIPEWFSYPEVIAELRNAHPPKHKQGFTIFFTGLPSSGKSTLANALALKLREIANRQITMLDGDVIRTHLSHGLGFSQEDREMNVTRVGFVAKEITKHGGIAVCALVSPFNKARMTVRDMITEVGGYIEVYVATPLAVCEKRDRKGLYKKARSGHIKQFTGISDPYEEPIAPELKIDTSDIHPENVIEMIINKLNDLGYLQHAPAKS